MIDWLAHQARISPRKVALIFEQEQWTYRQLDRQVEQLAGGLVAAGVESGTHTAVLMPNRPEFVFLIHALARLGALLVPLNTRLTPSELAWQLNQADCRFLIYSEETESAVGEFNVRALNVNTLNVPIRQHSNLPTFHRTTVQGIVFTSGTSGQPKGAKLTFDNHLWSATASAFRLGTDPADRWLLCMPLYHVGGMAIVLRCCLYGTTVVLQNGFDPAAVAHALDAQDVTLISVVPTMLHRLLEHSPQSLTRAQLRCMLIGGAALPEPLLEQCRTMNLPIATTYGLTEAASQVVTNEPGQAYTKPGSVGKPLMFLSVRVVDEAGSHLPAGNIGEIVVRGPTLMQGYYNQPEATQNVLRDGQLFTGDMGYLDHDGDLWVVQRRSDLIISGGENVYPAEVEAVLRRHPAVTEACVVGLADAQWGQRVAAAVIVRPGAEVTSDELTRLCREQLAGYKQPRLICFVDNLPQTASGKIQREAVRQTLERLTE